MNKILSTLSLSFALLFAVIMIVSMIDIAILQYTSWLDWIFGVPLYGLIAVSFFLSLFTWLKDRTRYTFQYVVYSSVAAVITIGTLFYILIQFAEALENF
jgi:hypothetical protein